MSHPRDFTRAAAGAFQRLSAAVFGRFDGLLRRRAGGAENGGATVEFVILFPAFMMVFISSFEASIMLTRQVMLERAVDLVVREVRLDIADTLTRGEIARSICNRARILPDCRANLVVELTEISQTTYDTPTSQTPCVNQLTSIVPKSSFTTNRTGRMIMMRACYSVQPTLPFSVLEGNRTLGSHLVNDEDGTFRIVTTTAFVVEQN